MKLLFRSSLLVGILFTASSCSAVEADAEVKKVASSGARSLSASDSAPRMLAIEADYCSVCHDMKQITDKIAAECDQRKLRVEKFDVSDEKSEHLLDEYRVVALPTYLFIDAQGREVARLVGAQTESALRQALGALTGESCPGLGRVKKGNTKSEV